MAFCLGITSRIVMLSEGALALPRAPHSPPLDRLHHPLGTLKAAEGSPHSTRRVAPRTPSSPSILQQPLMGLTLNPFYSKKPLLCLLHLLLTFRTPSLGTDLIEYREEFLGILCIMYLQVLIEFVLILYFKGPCIMWYRKNFRKHLGRWCKMKGLF